jgi:hypothetical protein
MLPPRVPIAQDLARLPRFRKVGLFHYALSDDLKNALRPAVRFATSEAWRSLSLHRHAVVPGVGRTTDPAVSREA